MICPEFDPPSCVRRPRSSRILAIVALTTTWRAIEPSNIARPRLRRAKSCHAGDDGEIKGTMRHRCPNVKPGLRDQNSSAARLLRRPRSDWTLATRDDQRTS